MKRSRSIKLVTMASTSLALAACEEKIDTEGELYRTVSECQQSDFVPDADCSPLLEEGQRIHASTAPRYNSVAFCEHEHGRRECLHETTSGRSYYTPAPVGYFVLGAIAEAAVSNLVRPVYRERDRQGYYMTGGGYLYHMNNVRYGTTRSNIQQYNPALEAAPPRTQTRTTVASRSGFGSRSGGSFGS